MNDRLQKSYEHCRVVAKTEARNFYYSFLTLPPDKRAQMCAIYAFMRYSDDISDEAALSGSKHELLPRWRKALDKAFDGNYGDNMILPAFHDTAVKCGIPQKFFHDLIDGAEMDLNKTRYETFDELYEYCFRVASVVGFVCIHVWGFQGDDKAYVPAEACGIAFQLTNILRDVKEDAERGRVYLPMEDLATFGISDADLIAGKLDGRFTELMKFEAARARTYYSKAAPLAEMIDSVSRPTFVIMYKIYRGLLDRIETDGYDVFKERAKLSSATKLGIVAKSWLGSRVPGAESLLRV